MEKSEIDKVIDFINKRYDEEVPSPIKFAVRRKAKKIEKLDPKDFPESVRKCTIEEFLNILKTAYLEKKLKF